MSNESKILELLARKKVLFLEVEDLTEKMKYAPVEDLARIFESRGDALFLVGETDGEIRELVRGDKALESALDSSASPDGLEGAAADIFRASLSVKAVANRVLISDAEVMGRIESERDALLNRLEEINLSSQSVAGSYMRSVQTGFSQPTMTSGEKSI